MGFYAIGIGGTGARCLEAVVHCAAMGWLERVDRLHVGLIDPDLPNGNVARTQRLVELYAQARTVVGGTSVLPINILPMHSEGDVWSPFRNDQSSKPEFATVIGKAAMEGHREWNAQARMVDVLFTSEEQAMSMEAGFRGRPAIGSTIFSVKSDLADGVWATFFNQIDEDVQRKEPVRLMLFGSVFGGTGASGTPTLAGLLRESIRARFPRVDLRVGAALMLPYFSFRDPARDDIAASAGEFLSNSKAALSFYQGGTTQGSFDDIYFLGQLTPAIVGSTKESIGGSAQKNPPHFLEACAALALSDFARGSTALLQRTHVCGHLAERGFMWEDLPHYDHQKLRAETIRFVRFYLALTVQFGPVLEEVVKTGKPWRAPWFFDLGFGESSGSVLPKLQILESLARSTVKWLLQATRRSQGTDVELLRLEALWRMDDETLDWNDHDSKAGLNVFVERITASERLSYSQVWERVCAGGRRVEGHDPLSRLLASVHSSCDTRGR